ncbi:hypothetical protein Aple_044580 [Acrocarpospora pleiomorpha]|uniref:HTH tetR-type domain-containing protein n=1 Tax=Acrocarpospora pleiomorpha TaxID=90975 RepID=A0A5M3XKZ7_9ACTN|nr:TetR/AcrR family transcriptional regulator [Acrocarpospora pleiomorpha]GES21562.1 hypothetical protein Aple_044580 [Acrocarpospora pleiomorpha]
MAQPKASTPDAVLKAAAEVFRKHGYQKATIDDIAREAGISKPTVYRYAKSKQWLLEKIVKTVQDEMVQRLDAAWDEGLPAAERLRGLVAVNVEVSIHFRTFYNVSLGEQHDMSKRAAQQYRAWAHGINERTEQILRACVEEGSLELDGDLTVYTNLFQSMLFSLFRWYDESGPVDRDLLVDHIMGLVGCRGSATRQPA